MLFKQSSRHKPRCAPQQIEPRIGSCGSKNEPARAGARCARNGASGEARANRLIERC